MSPMRCQTRPSSRILLAAVASGRARYSRLTVPPLTTISPITRSGQSTSGALAVPATGSTTRSDTPAMA